MPLTHYDRPKQRITIDTDQIESKTLSTDVTLRENAVSLARIVASDYEGEIFLNKADIGKNLQIEFKYEDGDNVYSQIFGGWITDLRPSFSLQGELVTVTALGYGTSLVNMLVRQEYGTESENADLNTIKEILTDASFGIIPKYVEKVLATAIASGYSLNTSKIPDIASDFKYLYFPGKPALKALQDMLDLISAANVPNPGVHWQVIPSGTTAYFCLATIGAHEEPSPTDLWPTFWNLTQENSTIEVTKDMIAKGFQKKRSEANYILFIGNFRRPANGDKWTENNSADWGTEGDAEVADEGSIYKIGSYSIRGRLPNMLDFGGFYYPSSTNLNLDITKIGTKRTIPRIGFYIRRNGNVNVGGSPPFIELGTGPVADNNFFYHYLTDELPSADEWRHLSFPIGPYYDMDETTEWEWKITGSPNWADIDYINFWFAANAGDAFIYIDSLYIAGIVTRAAYDSTKIPDQKCKISLVRDDIPKDDTLIATDDSGQIAQFCKAELYRAVTEPIIGSILIPMKETIKAGQLAHIHGSRKVTGFHIDKNMRIIEAQQHFGTDRVSSLLTLTDDLKNSHPIQPTDAYSAIMKAVSPRFQDRQTGSLIAKEVDIEQIILEKAYST